MARTRAARAAPKLPVEQLTILAICRFAEPTAMTSVNPYLPEMMESFGIPTADVAKWAGITSAVFSLAQCCTAILWGRASDFFGRKPAILVGLTCTMIATLAWGFSSSLPMAITVRAFSGACNGNVGIIRTMVAEMVTEKELQPRAFSIMPLVWSLGSIFGPSLGGLFAKPVQNWPNIFGNSILFAKFPFLLPNLVASSIFIIGISTGILFLRETLESRRHKVDWGRALGARLVAAVKFPSSKLRGDKESVSETTSLLDSPASPSLSGSYEAIPTNTSNPAVPEEGHATLSEVFTRQSAINLVAYTFLALHSVAYDQLLPNFMHLPRIIPTPENSHLPFQFTGGFGLNSARIGTIFTLYGICGGIIQFLLFPPVARYYGILNCYKACGIAFPLVCIITPYTALLTDPMHQQIAIVFVMLVKAFAVIFAFPCSMILLTNSAASLRVLGTLNGVAVSMSAIGRAVGPTVAGLTFSWGQKRGYDIVPWFLLAIISAIGAVPLWFLVEMDGFSQPADYDDEDEESDDARENPIVIGPTRPRDISGLSTLERIESQEQGRVGSIGLN